MTARELEVTCRWCLRQARTGPCASSVEALDVLDAYGWRLADDGWACPECRGGPVGYVAGAPVYVDESVGVVLDLTAGKCQDQA